MLFKLVFAFTFCYNALAELKTSSYYKRIHGHETVMLAHQGLHSIDDEPRPEYPHAATMEFRSHGHHFKLVLRKNYELFSDKFGVSRINASGGYEKGHWSSNDNCFYHGDVIVNGNLSTHAVRSAGVHLTLCKGWGARGSIYVKGETFTIVPHAYHVGIRKEDDYSVQHRLDHPHLVYKESMVNREGLPKKWCGHSYHEDGLSITHKEHDHHHHEDAYEQDGFKRRLQTTTRYVELLIVNDPARVKQFSSNTKALRDNTISLINQVSVRYRNADFGASVGKILVVLSHIQDWDVFPAGFSQPALVQRVSANNQNPQKIAAGCATTPAFPTCYDQAIFGSSGQSYEVDETSYLQAFNTWQTSGSNVPPHDNAQLLSYYDFWASVVGFAGVSSMCIPSRSGGIDQATYSDGFTAATIAHEMGHNWGMRHDGQSGNQCSPSGDIMASIASLGTAATTFSSCSVTYLQTFFASANPTCVNNIPTSRTFSDCGNGLKEDGESCDCGQADCSTIDPCCDGSVCQLFFGSLCGASDACCDVSTCKLKNNGTVCRALDSSNTCDIAAETCNGGVDCPPDKFKIEGVACTDGSYGNGMCYQGSCVTWGKQCAVTAPTFRASGAPFTTCTGQSFHSGCGNLRCQDNSNSCGSVAAGLARVEDGTQCGASLQCKGTTCKAPVLSSRWIAESWSTCSPACRKDTNAQPGVQRRNVFCALQNGTPVDAVNCTGLEKPATNQTCGNYICNFCNQRGSTPPCQPNGVCNSQHNRCDCQPGYGGSNCELAPGLHYFGITSKAHSKWAICQGKSVYQTITDRVDPNNVLAANITQTCEFRTNLIRTTSLGLDTAYTFDRGDFVTVRFNTSGSITLVAVTLEDLSKQNYLWPFYVGGRLAPNKTNCIKADPNFADLTCDFQFQIPSDLIPGSYRIQMKFNNDPPNTVFSEAIKINCNNDTCAIAGGGRCASVTDRTCTCSANYFGATCSDSNCGDWSLSSLTDSATAVTQRVPRCSQPSLTCTAANPIGSGRCTCGIHWAGPFCELPKDGCSTLTTAGTCNADAMCLWNSNKCVYKDCFNFGQAGCTANNTNATQCQWSTTNNICQRRFCDSLDMPATQCQHNTIRRAASDKLSICQAWYCDCSTMANATVRKYATPTLTDTVQANPNNKLLTCQKCSLNCTNGATVDGNCTKCLNCPFPYRGPLCDSLFWVGTFAVNTPQEILLNDTRRAEYEKALVQDLGYVFSFTDLTRLGLYEFKPEAGGMAVFFYITWPTTNRTTAQAEGGWRMKAFKELVANGRSEVYRGAVTNETRSNRAFTFCLPYFEECDPSKQLNLLFYLIYCALGGFGFVLLLVVAYFCVCRQAVQRRQSHHIEEVHNNALEHHPSRRNAFTLPRATTPWHHQGLPEESYKYKKCLFVFNFVTAGFGFTILGMAGVMYSFANQTLLPSWTFWWLIFFGVIAVIIAVLGTIGEIHSNETLEENRLNLWLVVLFLITFTTVAIQIFILGWVILSYDPRGVAATGSLSTNFENRLKDTLQQQPDEWWTTQKQFECCGYDINYIPDPLATGKFCTTDTKTSHPACKPKLWKTVSDEFLKVLVFVLVFLLSQCALCWSSLCLACCINSEDFALTGDKDDLRKQVRASTAQHGTQMAPRRSGRNNQNFRSV